MKKHTSTKQLCLLALMAALLGLMAFTHLGYCNIGPLAITFNMIPVAIAAIAAGPTGGAIAGGVFGITSFLQCLGIGGSSAMGVILLQINPFLAFAQRFVPRVLAGLVTGAAYQLLARRGVPPFWRCAISGLLAAALNTALFMGALVLLFGTTPYLQGLMAGRSVLLFICTFVGVNALVEWLACTAVCGAVGRALYAAKLIS